jgi:hypothetical protein
MTIQTILSGRSKRTLFDFWFNQFGKIRWMEKSAFSRNFLLLPFVQDIKGVLGIL